MADEAIATVHQGEKPIFSGRGSKAYGALAATNLSQHKLAYGLIFLGLVAGSILYVSLGAHANGAGTHSSITNNSAEASTTPTAGQTNDSSVKVNLNTNQTSNNGQTDTHTTLNVNGEDVPVSGGSVHKTFRSSDGSTTVKINSDSTSTSNGGSD
ncbi:MAG TPA: hypothetical protein VLF39_03075 [Candidatus Saccharimonadales bacterium]|nr:hypothetical protein [Candidatus Saccharimonadales bacterium]